jgi:nuclear protein localization family protein 4
MVDHVEFEHPQIVDNFIGYWRATGLQRFGYLYGRYERYDDVPLGIKAVVAAIYEPPQQSATDGIELMENDPMAASVTAISDALGLYKVLYT